MKLWELSASEIVTDIKNRKISAYEVTKAHLERLEQINPKINAVVQEMPEEALKRAKLIDRKVQKNEPLGLLSGVPVTVKVNVDQENYPTTNGASINKNTVAKENSPVVKNFIDADAIIIGRTNAPSFSMRWFTNNQLHGHTKNPHNKTLTPGGSSGGASSAVAAGICPVAHGTDIAGSIRYPAYACGIHGLRPSFGKVPTFNATTGDRFIGGQLMAVSGPLARSINDIKLSLKALSKMDFRDPWCIDQSPENNGFEKRVAITYFPDEMQTDPKIVSKIQDAAAILKDSGWSIEEVECPSFLPLADINLKLWMAESSTLKSAIYKEGDPEAIFVFEHMTERCGEPNLENIMACIKDRAKQIRIWSEFLAKYPLLICPVSSKLPFIDQLDMAGKREFDEILDAQLTQLGLPVLGFPGLSLATGIENNVPSGIQLISNRFREDIILAAGEIIERELFKPGIAKI